MSEFVKKFEERLLETREKLKPFDSVTALIASAVTIFVGMIYPWALSIYVSYRKNELGWFNFQAGITLLLLVIGIIILIHIMKEKTIETFPEFDPVEGPVGRNKEKLLIMEFIQRDDKNKYLLILTGK